MGKRDHQGEQLNSKSHTCRSYSVCNPCALAVLVLVVLLAVGMEASKLVTEERVGLEVVELDSMPVVGAEKVADS